LKSKNSKKKRKKKLLEEQKLKEEEEKKLLEEQKLKEKELKNCEQLPSNVNKNRREEYLEPEEFSKVFGIPLDEFKSLPLWMQLKKKRAVGLA